MKTVKVFSYYFIIDFVVQSDWKARADVAKLLKHLKKELTLLVVSHDLRYGNRVSSFSTQIAVQNFVI